MKNVLNIIKTNIILTFASIRKNTLFLQNFYLKSKKRKIKRFDIFQSN